MRRSLFGLLMFSLLSGLIAGCKSTHGEFDCADCTPWSAFFGAHISEPESLKMPSPLDIGPR